MKQTIKKLGIIAAAMIIALAFIACVGPAGRPGIDGADGENGIDGAQGEKGDKGDQGEAGEKGDTGEPGDPSVYTAVIITFDSDGGSAVLPQKMSAGNWARRPENHPTKPIAGLDFEDETTPGLYRNAYQFDGWYLGDELYNFDAPVEEDITLKARWSNTPISLAGEGGNDIVTQTVNFIGRNISGEYTLLLDADVTVPGALSFLGNHANSKLTFMGITSERKISFVSSAPVSSSLIYVDTYGVEITLGKNITLQGRPQTENSTGCVVVIHRASRLIMQTGSKITGHTTSASSAIYLSPESTFIMEGGAITGNTSTNTTAYAPTNIIAHGTFVMSGGVIKDNSPIDIYFTAADVNPIFTDNAEVGKIKLQKDTANGIIVGSSDVKIGELNLASEQQANTMVGRTFILPAEGYTLPTNLVGNTSIISSLGSSLTGYRIANENGVGVLRQQ